MKRKAVFEKEDNTAGKAAARPAGEGKARTHAPHGAAPEKRRLSETAAGYLALLVRLAVIAAVGAVLFTRVFLLMRVTGNEMAPAVKDGDLLLAFRLQRDYAKNDVVIYTVEGVRCVGRVAALGHDVVMPDGEGRLCVNGTVQNGMLPPAAGGDGVTYPHTVREGAVFLLGDERTSACDSREKGDIPSENVEGKVFGLLRRRGL